MSSFHIDQQHFRGVVLRPFRYFKAAGMPSLSYSAEPEVFRYPKEIIFYCRSDFKSFFVTVFYEVNDRVAKDGFSIIRGASVVQDKFMGNGFQPVIQEEFFHHFVPLMHGTPYPFNQVLRIHVGKIRKA